MVIVFSVQNKMDRGEQELGSLGTLDRGVSKHRPRNDPVLLNGKWPLIQTGDVASSGDFIATFSSTYSELGLAQSRLWPAGTLCITIAANIAKTAILEFEACFPDSVVGFTSDEATVKYVQSFLSFLQPTLERQAPESAQKNINLKILRGLKLPVPPVSLREEFLSVTKELRAFSLKVSSSSDELEKCFESLKQRAFRGDL